MNLLTIILIVLVALLLLQLFLLRIQHRLHAKQREKYYQDMLKQKSQDINPTQQVLSEWQEEIRVAKKMDEQNNLSCSRAERATYP